MNWKFWKLSPKRMEEICVLILAYVRVQQEIVRAAAASRGMPPQVRRQVWVYPFPALPGVSEQEAKLFAEAAPQNTEIMNRIYAAQAEIREAWKAKHSRRRRASG